MYEMFRGATSFNVDISNWNVVYVADMQGMFMHATAFNKDISKWDVSRVWNMDYMFWGVLNVLESMLIKSMVKYNQFLFH